MILELGSDHRYDITHRALVMGILNRTPDSFFDGGQYFDFDGFLTKAGGLVDDGADFLDVGGVKAGPGPEVGTEEELERVVPAVVALATSTTNSPSVSLAVIVNEVVPVPFRRAT